MIKKKDLEKKKRILLWEEAHPRNTQRSRKMPAQTGSRGGMADKEKGERREEGETEDSTIPRTG